jgi:hypothetical protein
LPPDSNNRSESRSNVFLAAALNTGSRAVPVRIRNLSPRGALVEGELLPPVGSAVRLVRGALDASGDLAWRGSGQAGINFAAAIDVGAWVKRVGHGGQQQVDGVVSALRGGGTVSPSDPVTELGSLAAVSEALDRLCEDLAGTPNMSVQLGEKLVKLDSVAQALRRIATGKPC